ncbi:MAG: DUF3054 domain-containing protein [Halobacteriaceae archaeon]
MENFGEIDRMALLLYGPIDIVAIISFLLLGELRHHINPFQEFGWFLNTATPFVIGWIISSLLLGAYASKILADRRSLLVSAIISWIGADIIAQLLRLTTYFHGGTPLSFIVVTMGFGSLFISVGRLLVFSINKRYI